MIFHKNFEYLVNESKINQTKLAKELGVTSAKFRSYLEKTQARYNDLIRISEYFKISIDDLLTKDIENSDIIVYIDKFGDQIRKVVSKNYLQEEKQHNVSEMDIDHLLPKNQQQSFDTLLNIKIEEKLKELLNKYK